MNQATVNVSEMIASWQCFVTPIMRESLDNSAVTKPPPPGMEILTQNQRMFE